MVNIDNTKTSHRSYVYTKEDFVGPIKSTYPNTDNVDFVKTDLKTFFEKNGTSVEDINKNIKTEVINSGVGTCEGVVTAATSLINSLLKYDVKLPYISSVTSSPSIDGQAFGKYNGYGINPTWGTEGKWWSEYQRYYYQTGLDCSGFISWALHNGGYKYQELHSSSFLNLGKNYSMSDYTGKAGDLLWRKGHIALILGVEDDGYVIAQEAGGENGLVVSKTSFNGVDSVEEKDFTTIVDMTDYYNNPSNLA